MGQTTPAGFLRWIADRLVHVYGEDENVDFVQAARRHADSLDQAARSDVLLRRFLAAWDAPDEQIPDMGDRLEELADEVAAHLGTERDRD